jgi:hypothetical protein
VRIRELYHPSTVPADSYMCARERSGLRVAQPSGGRSWCTIVSRISFVVVVL